jgi:hypothetical protein
MAITAARGYGTAPLNRSAVDRLPIECVVCALDLPGHELGTLLHHRYGSVLLGVQRRRGTSSHIPNISPYNANLHQDRLPRTLDPTQARLHSPENGRIVLPSGPSPHTLRFSTIPTTDSLLRALSM